MLSVFYRAVTILMFFLIGSVFICSGIAIVLKCDVLHSVFYHAVTMLML